jgi:hypothetical protein
MASARRAGAYPPSPLCGQSYASSCRRTSENISRATFGEHPSPRSSMNKVKKREGCGFSIT